MPYHVAFSADVENALFLRKFNVPFWALSHIFGKNAMYWHRMEKSLGKNSLIGTTIKDPNLLPEHLAADEKHSRLKGDKVYVATTVGNNCILGTSVSKDAGENDKMWNCYEAESKASFSQRVRRLVEWADAEEKLPDVISKPIMKLKKNLSAYSKAYDLPGCHRTSNMMNRLMQRMDRHLFAYLRLSTSIEIYRLQN